MRANKNDEKYVIRSEVDLEMLAGELQRSFSFDYKTMAEARKEAKAGIYTYTFNAMTLKPYDCNLNRAETHQLDELMHPFYLKMFEEDREAYKELRERIVLQEFISCAPEQYKTCEIFKHTRPDFILVSDKRIGIEVTELTTGFDKEVFTLARQIDENGFKTEKEVQKHIQRYHRKIADRIKYFDLDGKPSISTDFHNLEPKRLYFSEEIKTKYEKYKDEIKQYDEFIILANGASGSGLEISEKGDVEEIINHVLEICPDIIRVTTVIAWREAAKQGTINFSWYIHTK